MTEAEIQSLEELQELVDRYHVEFVANRLTRPKFYQLINDIESVMTPAQYQLVKGRIQRMHKPYAKTLAAYAFRVYDNTLREGKLKNLYAAVTGMQFQDNGFDNSGRLHLDARDLGCAADFRALIENEWRKLELKFIPCLDKYTIPEHQFNSHKDTYFLMFFTNREMIGPNGNPELSGEYEIDPSRLWVALVSPEEFKRAIEEYANLGYHWEQPGCPSYQIPGRKRVLEAFRLVRLSDLSAPQNDEGGHRAA